MSTPEQIAPFGAWPSPITSELIVSESLRLGDVATSGRDIYWTESRPHQQGRSALVRCAADGAVADVLPDTFNVRTRVHEYGGGSFFVHGATVFFSHDADARLYRYDPGRAPVPISAPGPWGYADGILDAQRGRVICVVEEEAEGEPVNYLGALDSGSPSAPERLVQGDDFYSNPRLDPGGKRLSWLSWQHPQLPWDGTELWLGQVADDGTITDRARLAGGPDESIFQPQWSPDGQLYFVSDRSGWWNLYRWDGEQVHAITSMEAEFGMPQWVFGMTTYAFLSEGRLACAVHRDGAWDLGLVEAATGQFTSLDLGYTDVQAVRTAGDAIVARAGSPTRPEALLKVSVDPRGTETLQVTTAMTLGDDWISRPRSVTFPAADGGVAHALFYPPVNPEVDGPVGEKAPLMVKSHGGPTSCADHVLSPRFQYWTSRGFAVMDVNYRGSTGYGRGYRLRLDGQWGIADVEDCMAAAQYAADQGWVDRDRMVISGGSAGGFTTLAALTFHDVFRAGASYYGVSDLEALVRDTHKFEARYLDRLVGPYPDRRDLYLQRSPLEHADQLSCPVIFFQGLEDKVVPPSQTETMVDALEAKGVPVAFVPFEGEQHGFRRAENIQRALDGEWYFYARILELPVPEGVEAVEIQNLSGSSRSGTHR